MRRLPALLVLAAALATSSAHAEPSDADTRASARAAMAHGDLARARELLRAPAAPDAASVDRAAAAELLYVIDLWSAEGRPPASVAANDAPAPDAEDDWERAFANARARLVSGYYAEAARRFDALVGVAPDRVAGARAAELRALAQESIPIAPPSAPPAKALPEGALPPHTETRWYGWQTLISDGVAIVTALPVPPLGLGIYALGAPIVHAFHGRPLAMLGDVALRVTVPVVGILLGAEAARGCDGFLCEIEGAAIGGLIGVSAAIAFDAALLAREEVRVEQEKKTSIVPLVGPGRVGVAGTF